MKKFYLMMLVLFMVNAYAIDQDKGIITKDLQTYLEQKSDNELIRVNIRLKEQMNQMNRYAQLKEMSLEQRRSEVVNDLKAFHAQSQTDLMSFLQSKPSSEFQLVRQLWIANVVTANVSQSVIEELALRSDLARIDIDEERQLVEAIKEEPNPNNDKGVDEITYNVLKVNADDVWALGYTGEGIIVSVIDAGINYNHVDLADHMWESTDFPNHGYDFHNNDNDPMDGHGHGTHCAGTVAGDGTAGSQTGMAPDALLMGCKVLGDDGSGQESNVWAAIEFSVEQGAHIISMSLGWSHSWNPDRPAWRTTLDNALAGGMVASIAAGNEGGSTSNPDDVRTPGDCPPPWLNPDQTLIGGISAVVCVGATNSNDNIASFSSRGPVTWETIDPFNDYPFNPELGLLRPDVSAPGVDVKSCNAFNINGYTTMSGTSMATPGVAGVMALLMSKNPGMSPEEICMTLETTSVDLGDEGKDNVFGSGRIDALVAIENTSEQGPVYEDHVFVDPNDNGELEAGESILLSMTMFNGSDMAYSNVDVTVSASSPYITMTDDTENYGDFPVGEAVTVEEGFAFDVVEDLPGQTAIRFNVYATDGTESWESKFDVVSWGPNISIGDLMVDDAAGNGNGRLDPGESAVLMIELFNTGQESISDVMFELDYSGSYLSFENTTFSLNELAEDGMEYASFNVTVSEDANIGQADMFTGNLSSGVFTDTKDFIVVIGLILEDWETGDFSAFEWGFSGGDWFLTDEEPYEGVYCAQSADIGDGQQSSLVIDYEAGVDGTISFFRKVSSESGYDYLRFSIDGVEKGSWSGEEAWAEEIYEVTAGLHSFVWQYSKDGSVSSGADAAWVDYVIFPPMALPNIEMTNEADLCEGNTFTSDAVVENAESILWSSNGDGSFDDETMAMATYTPGSEDIANGQVQLVLTASGANGDVHSSVQLMIFAAEADAPAMPMGANVLCINPDDQVYKTDLMDGYTLAWMLEPSEAGEIMATADSVLVMWADEFVGEASLSVMTSSICAESDYSEALTIEVMGLPLLSMDAESQACYGQEVMISGTLTGTAPWTINIEGYGDMIVESSPMEMSWTAMADSSMTVNWVQDAHMCLNEEPMMVSLVVNETPTVTLEDASICMNHDITLDAGNAGATFDWSTGGNSQTITVDSSGMNSNLQKEVSVMVTNEFGCSTEATALITFEDCSGIDELGVSSWGLYPNPSGGIVELNIDSRDRQEFTLNILNLQGQLIYSEKVNVEIGVNKHQLDLTDLAPQTYLLLLKNKNEQLIKRIIIE